LLETHGLNISKNIKIDFEKNFIAVWHDESHLNRYMIDNTPTKILTPSYCYPENMYLPYHKKLLALDKNHKELRS
jgi:histo-blood group ABO system transferase